MDKLFLDANILFSAAYRPNSGLLSLWKLNHTTLCSSLYAIEEAKRNLSEHSQRTRLEKLLLDIDAIRQEYTSVVLDHTVTLREKDQPILKAAIFSHADYLITGDYRDFGKYFGQTIQHVTILPPAEYLKRSLS